MKESILNKIRLKVYLTYKHFSVTRYIILQKALYDTCISRAKVTPFVSKKKNEKMYI